MRFVARLVAGALLVSVMLAGGLPPPRLAEAGRARKVENEAYPPEFRTKVRKAIGAGIEYLRKERLDTLEERRTRTVAMRDNVDYEEAAAVTWMLRRASLRSVVPVITPR